MHMFLLVAIHVFVFWFIPIQGNIKLYGSAECNLKQEKFYGCKNFRRNTLLQHFYMILCVYLLFSSLQLRRGFPIYKISSSLLSTYHPIG